MASITEATRSLFKTLDRRDFDALLKMVDNNAEGIDEISRKWLRGKVAFERYAKRVGPKLTDIRSRLEDLHTRQVGNVGIVTCMVHQSYKLFGRKHNLRLATSMLFVKRGTAWKFTLLHMTPL